DVAVSTFGAMFFDDAHTAFANIGEALRPGGQLAMLTWQDLRNNDWLMTLRDVFAMGRTLPFPPPAAPTPLPLADPHRVDTPRAVRPCPSSRRSRSGRSAAPLRRRSPTSPACSRSWLAAPDTNTYVGLYLRHDQEAYERYIKGRGLQCDQGRPEPEERRVPRF